MEGQKRELSPIVWAAKTKPCGKPPFNRRVYIVTESFAQQHIQAFAESNVCVKFEENQPTIAIPRAPID